MRKSFEHHQKQFDVLMSCDNSVPPLLSDSDILIAFKEFYNCLKPDGGHIITLRDYEKENREEVQVKSSGIRVIDSIRYTKNITNRCSGVKIQCGDWLYFSIFFFPHKEDPGQSEYHLQLLLPYSISFSESQVL